jgi:hypothetical protein
MTAPPDDRGQLDFLQHVQRILDEGEFVPRYKFALLMPAVRDARPIEWAYKRGNLPAARSR